MHFIRKRQQIIDDLRLFKKNVTLLYNKWYFKKMFLDTISDNKDLPKFVTKKLIEIYEERKENYDVNKEIELKHQC